MRFALRFDPDGTTVRTEEVLRSRDSQGIIRHAIQPGTDLYGIAYSDWAALTPGPVYLVDDKLTRAPTFEPELLQWLDDHKPDKK